MTTFLQPQTEALAAYARATATQQLPALPPYMGEGKQTAGDGFEQWIDRFKGCWLGHRAPTVPMEGPP